MAADPRSRHLRRLRRRRRSSRRWIVFAGTFGGASAVLVPYAGLGLPDAFWAAAAGGSAVLATLRWLDYRRLAALPIPEESSAVESANGLGRLLQGHPFARALTEEWRRRQDQFPFRDSASASAWDRLLSASRAMEGLAGRLPLSASESVTEGLAAERALRDLAYRIVDVERGLAAAPVDARGSLQHARDALVAQLTEGVEAYERLVAAVAECVAEGARSADNAAAQHLTEATDRLVGLARGLGEMRDLRTP